jgi:hypothetical protein
VAIQSLCQRLIDSAYPTTSPDLQRIRYLHSSQNGRPTGFDFTQLMTDERPQLTKSQAINIAYHRLEEIPPR